MKIKFYQNGLEIEEKIKQYLESKVNKLKKFIQGNVDLVEIEVEKDKKGFFRVEIQIKVAGAKRYIGEEKGKKIEEACDLACDGLTNQIKKSSDKRRTLERRGALSIKKRFAINLSARKREPRIK